MKSLSRELTEIARQFQGSENIFGYKTTLANQLYWFYCFSGKIYFTDKMPKHVRFLWYFIVSSQILLALVMSWSYVWYESAKNDFVAMLNVAIGVGCLVTGGLGFPLILYLFGHSIETMIDRVDEILATEGISDSNQKKIVVDAKKTFLAFIGTFGIFFTVLLSICFLDVILFFEEAKVKNYLYYMIPIFLIRKYSSIRAYFVINGISTMFFAVMSFEVWMPLGVMSYWSTVWQKELISLRDELNSAMRDSNEYFEDRINSSDDWDDAFERILQRSIVKFQKITLLINDLKGFFQVFGMVLIPPVYLYGVFFLYNSFSIDVSTVLMVKYVTGCLASIVPVFHFYWIGQNIENLVSEVSMAIYSTPWYRSVKIREKVHIFLCQTQSVKTFTIFKVYRLLLNNFSRYAHALLSCTNILHRLTEK